MRLRIANVSLVHHGVYECGIRMDDDAFHRRDFSLHVNGRGEDIAENAAAFVISSKVEVGECALSRNGIVHSLPTA